MRRGDEREGKESGQRSRRYSERPRFLAPSRSWARSGARVRVPATAFR
jgi:hypothetical protein